MASLIQGLKNLKANIGTAASELQHVANLLQPGASQEEKKFLEAVYGSKPLVAAQLLSANPNVIFARTKDWHNAWHVAAQTGNLPMLEVLHTHGRGATRKPLPGEPPQYAAKTRDTRETPLMLACAGDHIMAMQYLLGVGASATDGDKYGNTIIHSTALRGQVKMLSLLLASDEGLQGGARGATRLVDVRNEAGLQPLHFAVWGGKAAAVQVLFDYRPDLVARSSADSMAQVTCNGGSTPLHVAALKNDPGMVNLLLQEYVRVTLDGRGSRSDPRTVTDNYAFTAQAIAKDLKREAVIALLDPTVVLKGLEPGAVAAAAAAGGIRSQMSMRRSIGGSITGRISTGGTSAAAAAAVAAAEAFDGFSALAAGSISERKSPGGKGAGPVPILAPPPPPGAKAGKALAATLHILPPPPSAQTPKPADETPASATTVPMAVTATVTPGTPVATASPAAAAPSPAPVAASPAAAAPSPAQALATLPATPGPAEASPSTPPTAASPASEASSAPATTSPEAADNPATAKANPVPATVSPEAANSPATATDSFKAADNPATGNPNPATAHPPHTVTAAPSPAIPLPAEPEVICSATAVASPSAKASHVPPPELSTPTTPNGTVSHAEDVPEATDAISTITAQQPSVPTSPSTAQPSTDPGPAQNHYVQEAKPQEHRQTEVHTSSSSHGKGNGNQQDDGDPPPFYYFCPITNQLMTNPVIAGDGRAYEADAIQMWLSLNGEYFPGGTEPVVTKQLEPADALRAEIAEWRAAHRS